MIDHIGLAVADLDKSKSFYMQALAPLGYHVVMEHDGWVAFGLPGEPKFWIHQQDLHQRPMHICFSAKSRADVDAFHHAAVTAGAPSNGEPGIREQYHPNYYGAFVLDPDGHNVEAVHHLPE